MITCSQHDFIEIACLYRLPVLLTYRNALQLAGTAIDTALNSDRKECMIVSTGDGEVSVILDDLKSIKALEVNPHFDIVYFD